MIDDSALHRVLKIGELTRAIASHLTPISLKSAVNLACTCRYLEEPVLSTLWEEQSRLDTLLEVLPKETRDFVLLVSGECVVRGLGLLLQMLNAQVGFASGQGRGKSDTRGLEESPPLRVLDASNPCGSPRCPWGRGRPPISPQLTF